MVSRREQLGTAEHQLEPKGDEATGRRARKTTANEDEKKDKKPGKNKETAKGKNNAANEEVVDQIELDKRDRAKEKRRQAYAVKAAKKKAEKEKEKAANEDKSPKVEAASVEAASVEADKIESFQDEKPSAEDDKIEPFDEDKSIKLPRGRGRAPLKRPAAAPKVAATKAQKAAGSAQPVEKAAAKKRSRKEKDNKGGESADGVGAKAVDDKADNKTWAGRWIPTDKLGLAKMTAIRQVFEGFLAKKLRTPSSFASPFCSQCNRAFKNKGLDNAESTHQQFIAAAELEVEPFLQHEFVRGWPTLLFEHFPSLKEVACWSPHVPFTSRIHTPFLD